MLPLLITRVFNVKYIVNKSVKLLERYSITYVKLVKVIDDILRFSFFYVTTQGLEMYWRVSHLLLTRFLSFTSH